MSSIFHDCFTPHEMLSNFETIDSSKDWIISLFSDLLKNSQLNSVQYDSAYVSKTISFINKNYSKVISLSNAADDLGIGSTYLSKLFKEAVGIGFSEYLGNVRIEKSKSMLDSGNYKIKNIINICGFSNYDYFIKFFKKKVGITPKEYILSKNK